MDTSSLAHQVESVERNIVFLRQEQLKLLHGLHLEILSLQKRCTELTRELHVKPPGRSEEEVRKEEELLEVHCEELEGQLMEQQGRLEELHNELRQKGVLVGALRASLKDKERRFLEELKRRSHRTTVLNTELQKQTEAAAYLSFQLHSARQKLYHQQQQQQQQPQRRRQTQPGSESSSLQTPPSSTGSSNVVKPKRRSGTRSSSQLRAERARECVPRERVTGPEEPTAMPDPALFLYPRRLRVRPRQPSRQLLEDRDGEEGPEELQRGEAARLAAPPAAAPGPPATAQSKAE
ncbi:coiled-coil domain-containing protein 92 [Chanos chanos]|uniref:Coiled-coil domain-containing protein 92 n=1 Tax=Chanos chanos TaxID=29144 RepID=A0A6J2VRA8_CHACN|nr:coiled-coil domain containing 92B [Chanos chanos]